MMRIPGNILLGALLVTACSADLGAGIDPTEGEGDPTEGTASSREKAPGRDPDRPGDGDEGEEPGGIVADLRADTNRDGIISFEGKGDDDGEDVWNAQHGAIFLANIDDDEAACDPDLSDVELPKCNDAADDVVNGPDDALDLARLKTKPWADAPAGTRATIAFTVPERVRVFKVSGSSFSAFESGQELSSAEVKSGVELAVEGKDVVRDASAWDGFVDFTLKVDAGGQSKSDEVRMRIAPVLTYHHLLPTERTWVSSSSNAGNQALRADLAIAAAAAGVPAPLEIKTSDSWAQDYFETGFMSMPGPGGEQHVIRVNIRSANEFTPKSTTNPLRPAGKVVWQLRGKDTAGLQEYDKSRNGKFDTLNSFGNFETVPPYTHGGASYPLGRVLRGQTASYYPDKVFQKMIESQKVQPPIYVDTSWLVVGHVDETLSFVKASTPRGWVLLVNDARLARQMLQAQANAGRGNTPMFVGKYWDSRTPAQVTIDQALSDTDVMSSSAEAAVEVDAQIQVLKDETGLTDAEIVRVPFLHMSMSGQSIAYQPGMVNGLYLADGHFVAPDPHGPVIGGEDVFQEAMISALAPLGITVHFAEDWDTYHRQLGEVHCGTNSTRQIPQANWWESGR